MTEPEPELVSVSRWALRLILDLLENSQNILIEDDELAAYERLCAEDSTTRTDQLFRPPPPLGEVSAAVLRAKPTLAIGQTDDLKIDTGRTRYWLARTTIEDGEPYDDRVSIERLVGGRWLVVHVYPGSGYPHSRH